MAKANIATVANFRADAALIVAMVALSFATGARVVGLRPDLPGHQPLHLSGCQGC